MADTDFNITSVATSPSEISEMVQKRLNQRLAEEIEKQREKFQIDESRTRRVTRVRKGEVQRRKRVSDKDGYTVRNGKSKHMKASERRNRSRSQRRGARKRRGKKAQTRRSMNISLRKRNRLGK